MNYSALLLFLVLGSTEASYGFTMRIFWCKALDLDVFVTLMPEQSYLEIETKQKCIRISKPTIVSHAHTLEISALVLDNEIFSFRLTHPGDHQALVNERGLIEYQEEIQSELKISKSGHNISYEMNCQVFDLTDKYFDFLDNFPP